MTQPTDPDEKKQHDHQMREEAEDRLSEPDRKFSDLSGKTSEEIIHELRVQQIELEIQNEELTEAHLDLEVSKDRYINLYDFAPVGYFTLTDKGLISEINLTGAAMLGGIRRDIIQVRFRTFVTANDHDQWDQFLITVLQHEGKSSCDLQIIRNNDIQFFGRIEGLREDISDGSIQIHIAMSDVTTRKREENELLRKSQELFAAYAQITASEEELRHQYNSLAATEADLRQTKENLESLISIANVPIIIWDLSFHITRLNMAAEILIGRSSDEILGKPIDILFPPELKERSMRLLRTTHEGVRWETVEVEILHQDGTIRTVLWNSATLYTPDGVNPVATIAQGQDITDLKRLEKEKDASVAQIQKNLAQLATLNDEIRNPLSVIAMYADMIESSKISDTIINQIHRIDLMINQIDRRWNESEKILTYLRKHHQIDLKASKNKRAEEIDCSPLDKKILLIEEVQAELFNILDSIDALIYVADMETYDLLYINKRGRGLFGSITGKKCYQTIQKNQAGPCPFCTNHLLNDESGPTGVYQWEFQNTQNNRWYDCRDRAIRWSDGRLVRLEIAIDVTEYKQMEDELRSTHTRLESSMEAGKIAWWEMDCITGGVIFNERKARMLGYPCEQFSHYTDFTRLVHPDDYAPIMQAMRDHLSGIKDLYEANYRIQNKTGEYIWFHDVGRISDYTSDGRPSKIIGLVIDISERKSSDESLQEANQKLRLLTSLTHHDILNQISAVHQFQDLALQSSDLMKVHEYISLAKEAGNQIEETIGFTREYESFGVESSGWQRLYQIIESAKTEVSLGGVTFSNQIPESLEIYVDPIIRKIFSTLIENAIRHGGTIRNIRLFNSEIENSLILTCEDDGVGVQLEEKPYIFDHGFGKHTGIGLFLAREILSISGFSIRETGVPGKGARFEITVPAGKFRGVES
ncbi:MAG TPA: PAS domain S-box protein [Methanospirillum sp.]|nr:PAS domain S-box protein [Methanospirillum sp.]